MKRWMGVRASCAPISNMSFMTVNSVPLSMASLCRAKMITSSSASCAGEMESDVKGMSPAENAENFLTTTITKKRKV